MTTNTNELAPVPSVLPLSAAGAWWGRRTGRAELGQRVQDQVDHLIARGVPEAVIRDLVRQAAAAGSSILGPGAAVPTPTRTTPAVPRWSDAAHAYRMHRVLVDRIEAGTGWPTRQALAVLLDELQHYPDGVDEVLPREVADMFVRACVATASVGRIDHGAHGVPAA